MKESFTELLVVGGKSNSLGRADEVTHAVLRNKARLDELYACLFNEDAWIRMRAADCLEKICRVHPEWLVTYIDRLNTDLASSKQASIQWHIAQIYRQVDLSSDQKEFAISWLERLLSTTEVDWIVATNAMDTLNQFRSDGSVSSSSFKSLLEVQLKHNSKSVVKRANKYLSLY